MAPDKIYLQACGSCDLEETCENCKFADLLGSGGVTWSEERIYGTDIEYIRKDALLEWLRKEYETISWYHEKMQHVTGCVGDTDSSGKAEAYKEVIEKIESL